MALGLRWENEGDGIAVDIAGGPARGKFNVVVLNDASVVVVVVNSEIVACGPELEVILSDRITVDGELWIIVLRDTDRVLVELSNLYTSEIQHFQWKVELHAATYRLVEHTPDIDDIAPYQQFVKQGAKLAVLPLGWYSDGTRSTGTLYTPCRGYGGQGWEVIKRAVFVMRAAI